ncbi:hypothetical protein ABT404_24305 [Streptomyces hyaluromycini]|uniref:Uncharacterized protein n=1 Tax=Streptomyces hyaluromycini TaxID=1377993 RepID=A0ABV1X0N5_9ACTN
MPRHRDLDGRHLTDVHGGVAAPDTVWSGCRTRTSDIRTGLAARLLVDARITEATSAPLRAVQHLSSSSSSSRPDVRSSSTRSRPSARRVTPRSVTSCGPLSTVATP